MDSPCVEVVDLGGFAARTPHDTADADPALALFRTLALASDFAALSSLCREKLLTAKTADDSLRWQKDYSIVKSFQGKYGEALDLLAAARWLASGVGGKLRGSYENEFALVLVEFNRPLVAFDHFDLAREFHRGANDLRACAEVDNNTGRAYAAQGESVKASEYFGRALEFARSTDDYRLQLEVCESILEFGGVR